MAKYNGIISNLFSLRRYIFVFYLSKLCIYNGVNLHDTYLFHFKQLTLNYKLLYTNKADIAYSLVHGLNIYPQSLI